MGSIINYDKSRKRLEDEKRKEYLLPKLEKLFWQEPTIYCKLCDYCMDWPYSSEFDDETKEYLTKEGFLSSDDSSLPNATYEVVYYAMTGHDPIRLK